MTPAQRATILILTAARVLALAELLAADLPPSRAEQLVRIIAAAADAGSASAHAERD